MENIEIIVPIRTAVNISYDHDEGILTLTMPDDVTTMAYRKTARFGRILGYSWPDAPEGHVYIADCLGDNDRLPRIAGFLKKSKIVDIVDDDVRPRLNPDDRVVLARVLI